MNPIQQIKDKKVYAVVRVDNPEKAVSISRALIKGGIDIIELMVENAELIKAGLSQTERFYKLHEMARQQMKVLLRNNTSNKLGNVNPNLLIGGDSNVD